MAAPVGERSRCRDCFENLMRGRPADAAGSTPQDLFGPDVWKAADQSIASQLLDKETGRLPEAAIAWVKRMDPRFKDFENLPQATRAQFDPILAQLQAAIAKNYEDGAPVSYFRPTNEDLESISQAVGPQIYALSALWDEYESRCLNLSEKGRAALTYLSQSFRFEDANDLASYPEFKDSKFGKEFSHALNCILGTREEDVLGALMRQGCAFASEEQVRAAFNEVLLLDRSVRNQRPSPTPPEGSVEQIRTFVSMLCAGDGPDDEIQKRALARLGVLREMLTARQASRQGLRV